MLNNANFEEVKIGIRSCYINHNYQECHLLPGSYLFFLYYRSQKPSLKNRAYQPDQTGQGRKVRGTFSVIIAESI
jgi:hypothetical protein